MFLSFSLYISYFSLWMYLVCWRVSPVVIASSIIVYDGMALHCLISLHAALRRAQHLLCPCRCLLSQSLYISSMKNQHRHWVCWMSTGRKNGFTWRTHAPYSDQVPGNSAASGAYSDTTLQRTRLPGYTETIPVPVRTGIRYSAIPRNTEAKLLVLKYFEIRLCGIPENTGKQTGKNTENVFERRYSLKNRTSFFRSRYSTLMIGQRVRRPRRAKD